jgi:hypothetical protein
MSVYQIDKLLLILASCLVGQLSLAQQAAVAPLAPRQVLVQPANPDLGVPVRTKAETGEQPTVAPQPPSTSSAQAVRRAWPEPVYLVNARVIIGGLLDEFIKPMDIANIDIYKGNDAPAQWRSLTEHGIVSITLKAGVKPKYTTESLSHISRRLKLTGVVSFQLNGLRIEDEKLCVATESIAGLDIVRDDFETVVNIRLLPPKPTPPTNDPPGTIRVRIRGVAGR